MQAIIFVEKSLKNNWKIGLKENEYLCHLIHGSICRINPCETEDTTGNKQFWDNVSCNHVNHKNKS